MEPGLAQKILSDILLKPSPLLQGRGDGERYKLRKLASNFGNSLNGICQNIHFFNRKLLYSMLSVVVCSLYYYYLSVAVIITEVKTIYSAQGE